MSETTEQTPSVEEIIDYKDKYLRLLADVENTRKRMQKEKIDTMRFAVENVLADIIGPMDNLENALKFADQMSGEVKNWALGFQMILAQFKDVLTQNGIAPFASEGEFFDAAKHEAVELEETSDVPDGTILKEFVKGYRCGDRIIRAARVKVAKKSYRAQEGSVNLGSARQSQVEAKRSERGDHSKTMGDEKDQFGKVAASQNSPNLTERGITKEEGVTNHE